MEIKIFRNLLFFTFNICCFSTSSYAEGIVKRFPAEGYDSFLNTFQSNCLEKEIDQLYYIGQNTGNTNYYFDQTSTQMKNKLNMRGSGGVNFGFISGNTEISLSKEYSSDSMTLSLVYENVIIGKSAIIIAPLLTNIGKSSINLSAYERQKICGNKFISGIHLGARFLSNLKIYFRNEEAKLRFIATVSFQILWASIAKNIIDERLIQFKNDLSISVSAVQYGGDVNTFQNYVQNLGGQPSCSIDHLLPCQIYFQNLLKYSSEDFPRQLNDMNYSLNPYEGLIALSYHFSEYSKHGFPYLASNISDYPNFQEALKQKDALREIQNKIEEEFQNNERATQLILNQKIFLLEISQVNLIQEVYEKSKHNLSLLKLAKENCSFNTNKCTEIKDAVFAKIIVYDNMILSPNKPL